MTRTHIVSATVVTEDPSEVLTASELMNRISVGLSMQGITVRMDFSSFDNEELERENSDDEDSAGENPHSP